MLQLDSTRGKTRVNSVKEQTKKRIEDGKIPIDDDAAVNTLRQVNDIN